MLNSIPFVVYLPESATVKFDFNLLSFLLISFGPYPLPKLTAVLRRAYSLLING